MSNQNLDLRGTYRITGVPGAGKTTRLVEYIKKAIAKHGSSSIVVTSFTKAAATEIAEKAMQESGQFLMKHQLGTLHALAYQALNKPKMIEVKKHFLEWNDHIRSKHPSLQITVESGRDLDDIGIDAQQFNTDGDKLFNEYSIKRNRMVDPLAYSDQLAHFSTEWERWKLDIGGIDFTDMLVLALRDVPEIPWQPTIGFLDEANDCTKLQLALWQRWSRVFQYNIIAGDSDQCIYNFAGCDAGAFLDIDVAENKKRYLLDSNRCPQLITDYANKVIQLCKHRDQTVVMRPRKENNIPVQGFLDHSSATFKVPDQAIQAAQEYISNGFNVAFLTTCSYMLHEIIATLRKEAIPFENKYRRKRGDWNPLNPSNGTSAAEKLLAFCERPTVDWEGKPSDSEDVIITTAKIKKWISVIGSAGVFNRGAKKEIEETLIELPGRHELLKWFDQHAFEALSTGDLNWFEEHLLTPKKKSFEFSLAIAKHHGLAKLKEKPQITVGTIHSVKGATFDVVFLFPDLSYQGYQEWHTSAQGRDSIIRTWYVGITRAKEGLVLCSPASEMAVRI